ncbi:MAG TPA: hypothetical protein VF618_17825 [Thermoanaerobaculia bacterium]
MEIWIEAEHAAPATDVTNDNCDVIVTLDDESRWAATFITPRNIEFLRASYVESGECLSGRYFWASSSIIVDEITRPTVEAVVAHLQETCEFEHAFEELVPPHTIRLQFDQAGLRGTCYFELLPGKYRGECWNEGSAYIAEETWGYIEPVIEALEPRYDHYAFVDVPAAKWREIVDELRVLAAKVATAQKVAQLPDGVGFFYRTSRSDFAATFTNNRNALVAFIRELCLWVERQLLKHEFIAVLGI